MSAGMPAFCYCRACSCCIQRHDLIDCPASGSLQCVDKAAVPGQLQTSKGDKFKDYRVIG